MAPNGKEVTYGALKLSEDTQGAESGSMRTRVSVIIGVAAMMSVAAFAFGAGNAMQEPTAVTAVTDFTRDGDDLAQPAPDCDCTSNCFPVEGKLYGECSSSSVDGKCMGVDYEMAYQQDGVWWTHCEIVSGSYDCGNFPCRNGGFCMDGSETYTCVCPWGWEGRKCELDINECSDEVADEEAVCHPDARCTNMDAAYSCACNAGFSGDGYAVDEDAAFGGSVTEGVTKHGWLDRTVSDDVKDGAGGFLTEYDHNRDGAYDKFGCTDVNDCASNPCQNGGLCIDMYAGAYFDAAGEYQENPTWALAQTDAYVCDCTVVEPAERWAGDHCEEDIDECTAGEHNCDKDESAECVNSDGSFSCQCKEFWQGDALVTTNDKNTVEDWGYASGTDFSGCTDINDCEIIMELATDEDGDGVMDVSITSPCLNGGTCTNAGDGTGEFECFCVSGWELKTCGKDIDECATMSEAEVGCDMNAHCHNTPGSWMCLCNNGWTGDGDLSCWDADDCEFSPCQHGGTCEDCGTLCLICDCIVGWRGKTCEVDWDECKMGIHTCHDMAICANVPGSFNCECEPGYSGDGYAMCNEVDDCQRWEDDRSRDDNTLVDYAVKIYAEDGTLTESSGVVSPAPWADDLEITVPGPEGTVIDVHQCGEWDPITRVWKPHGTCEDTGAKAFVCSCDVGWSDSNCDLDIDECARSIADCHKYADCVNLPGSYVCSCKLGYTGDGIVTCHDIDDCSAVGPGTEKCFAGKCVDLGPGDFRCVCNEGYGDRLCNDDIDECSSFTHTCAPEKVVDGVVVPGAKCTNMPGSFKCACRPGFTGDGIGQEGCADIDDCGSAPCENGACQDNGQASWSCTCDLGWTDTRCDHDVNECYTGAHDCHPEGKCVNTPGGYYCRCVSGHTGDGYTCTDLDDCDPDPCDPEHGTCHDNGANKYTCHCDAGFAGMGCEQDEVECAIGTHECHANADCFNTYGSYICACKDEFYGNGVDCAPCTDCGADCGDNEDTQICPGHEDYNGPHDTDKMVAQPWYCPTDFSCGHGAGYENDNKFPPCAAIDRTCVEINECQRMTDNCNPVDAECKNTEGSFTCMCRIVDQKWGTGLVDECWDCTKCELGTYMLDDCTATTDRTCRQQIYDGNYALETTSGGTSQCLVHFKDAGKIFPERYSWGGRLGDPESGYGTQSIGKYEMWGGGQEITNGIKGVIPAPDICQGKAQPICGVCNYSGKSPAQNIMEGMEAVWTFMHLELDLYLILQAADGNGFRCMGFQTPDAPYPSFLTWEPTVMQQETGACVDAETDELPILPNGKPMKAIECSTDADCSGALATKCLRGDVETGEWVTDGKGPGTAAGLTDCGEDEDVEDGQMRNSVKMRESCKLAYFCGFETTELGGARDKLMSNGGTVWNVSPLACQGLYCESRWTADTYMIRSLASGDENNDGEVDNLDYRCLYFPADAGSIPRRTPKSASDDGVWLGAGGSADADGSGDPDCGIALRGEGGAAQSAALKLEDGTDDEETQEKELLLNHQAVFRLIKLPNF